MASEPGTRTDPPPTDPTGPTSARRRPALVVGAVVATLAVGVGLWLTQPWLLLVDAEVDDAFPVAEDATGDAADATAATETAATAATDDGATDDASTSGEPGSDAGGTAVDAGDPAGGAADEVAEGDEADASGEPDAGVDESPANAPVALLAGTFASRDHQTSGRATVYRLPDGSLTLRFEDLATDNGPDLFVYLDQDPGDAPADAYDDGTDLGRLKGNLGNQNYDVPPDTDLDALRTVVIWCDRFASPFGTVELAPVA